MADGDARPRTLCVPAAALHALRTALLGLTGGGGEIPLRDAGYRAGLALYDDFAADVRELHGLEPDALPLARFADALATFLDASGWGTVHIDARPDADVVHVTSADWVEGEPDAGAAYPMCHFSTGMLAGFFGRAARQSLAVLETSCRSTGAAECAFAIGSPEVLDRMWANLKSSLTADRGPEG